MRNIRKTSYPPHISFRIFSRQTGFTLIELLVVITVLGVLATIVLLAVNPGEQLARARDTSRIAGVTQVGRALLAYYTVAGGSLSGVPNGVAGTATGSDWMGPLITSNDLKVRPTNPGWGTAPVAASNCDPGFKETSVAPGPANGNAGGYCYQVNLTTSANDAVVYLRLESNFYNNKCTAPQIAYGVFSTADARFGVVCLPPGATSTDATPGIQPPTSGPITGLHTQGNTLVTGYGQQIVLHGVNRSGTEYACVGRWGIFDGPSDQTSITAMKAWNVNVVRVPLNEDCWLGINGVNSAYGGNNYQGAIVNYVDLLNQNGIYTIVELHWNAPGTTLATGQQVMADEDHAPAFWASVATKFKGNNNVIFDLYNEPHDITWSCWLNGGSCGPFRIAGMQQLVTTIRATGATNVIMAGGLSWANDISNWLTYKPTDSQNNLIASMHIYNNNSCITTTCFTNQVMPVANQVPVIVGELGEYDCASGFISTVMPWFDQHNISYLGWSWNVDSCGGFPSLISNYDGTPTNFGIGFQTHLKGL